jgi:hypothetical protein
MNVSINFPYPQNRDDDLEGLSKWCKNHALELTRILNKLAVQQSNSNLVPYTGALDDVDLGVYSLTAHDLTLTGGKITYPDWVAGTAEGLVYRGTAVFISDFAPSTAGERNLFIGRAGNLTMPTGAAYQSSGNVGIGFQTLQNNTLGYSNVGVGYSACRDNTTGFRNVGIGLGSLLGNTTGSDNVAIGTGALAGTAQTSKSFNVALGYYAGNIVSTGGYNILIGYRCGDLLTTGSNNILIGQDIDVASATGNYQLKIDNLMEGEFAAGTEYLNVTNHLGITSMKLGTPTYKYIDDWFNTIQSSGRISGMALTDGGSGTINVSAGTGIIKTTDAVGAVTKFFDFAGQTAVALTDNRMNWLYMDYSGGVPVVRATVTRADIHEYDQFPIGRAYREGATVDIVSSGCNIYNGYRRIHNRLVKCYGFKWASGATTSEAGTRNIIVTAGVWYIGNTEITTSGIDTTGPGGGTFSTYYFTGAVWVKTAAVTAIDNVQYNDVSTGLANIGNNKYVNAWIYTCPQGDVYHVYGQAQYNTLAEAEVTQTPTLLPDYITANCRLIARITLKQGVATFISLDNALITSISLSTAVSHNNLAGLDGGTAGEYYHFTSARYNDLLATGSPTFAGLTIGASTITDTMSLLATSGAFQATDFITTNNTLLFGSAGGVSLKYDSATFVLDDDLRLPAANGLMIGAVEAPPTAYYWAKYLSGGIALGKGTAIQDTFITRTTSGTATDGTLNLTAGNSKILADGQEFSTGTGGNIISANATISTYLTTLAVNFTGVACMDYSAAAWLSYDGGNLKCEAGFNGNALILRDTVTPSANTITIASPALAGSLSLTLPSAYAGATGYILSSTDAGVLSWIANTGHALVTLSSLTGFTLTGQAISYTAGTNIKSLVDLSYASASFVKMTGANTFALDTNVYYKSGDSPSFATFINLTGGNPYFSLVDNSYATEQFLIQPVSQALWIRTSNDSGASYRNTIKISNTAPTDTLVFAATTGAATFGSTITSTGLTVNGATVLNEAGADADTRIEGDTDANLLFVNAGEDVICIGQTGRPASYISRIACYESADANQNFATYLNGGLTTDGNGYGFWIGKDLATNLASKISFRYSTTEANCGLLLLGGFGDSNGLFLKKGGNVCIGDVAPTCALDINSDKIRIRTAKTPASQTDTGVVGDICWDASYIYVCTATNYWERTAIAPW